MKKITTLLATLALLLGVIPSTTAIDYTETISAVVYLESYTSTDDEWVSQGTGFIISVDAIILTAAHVILDEDTHEPMEYVDICTIDDEYSIPDCKYSGRILAFDEYLDLALLYPAYELDEYREETGEFIELEDAKNLNLPYVDLADYNPSLGDNLSVLGFPAASATPTITLSTGIVSGYTPLSLLFPELQDSEWIWEIETDAA
ncbi:MAG: serine protease, partial [Candidatus Peregrinibacteria bacterium]